ncbi:MAG: hypothetical protein OCU22_03555 [Canidatus Methanoxibalbensis ujae]|nr:hypothetical protein [Candidatus Methanoxibalbensis ujae]
MRIGDITVEKCDTIFNPSSTPALEVCDTISKPSIPPALEVQPDDPLECKIYFKNHKLQEDTLIYVGVVFGKDSGGFNIATYTKNSTIYAYGTHGVGRTKAQGEENSLTILTRALSSAHTITLDAFIFVGPIPEERFDIDTRYGRQIGINYEDLMAFLPTIYDHAIYEEVLTIIID